MQGYNHVEDELTDGFHTSKSCYRNLSVDIQMGLHGECYKGLISPRNTTKRRTGTVNPNDRQPAPLTDQAPETIAKSTHVPSRITPASTATLHTRQMRLASTTQNQQGPCQRPLSQRKPVRVTGGLNRTTTQTAPAPAGTCAISIPGGPPS